MKSESKNPKSTQIIMFCVVGAIAIAINYITTYLLTEKVHIPYTTSSAIGSACNLIFAFFAQRKWTWKNSHTTNIRKQIVVFFTMGITFIIATPPSLYGLVHYCGLWYMAAYPIVTIVFSTISFLVQGKIFAHKNPSN